MSELFRFKPDDETGRQAALDRYEVLDVPVAADFDDILILIRSVLNVPHAAVTLISRERQKAIAASGADLWNCPREDSFCNETICQSEPLSVSDALLDDRFSQKPSVTGAAKIRCYLGAPMTSPDGYNVGALCVWGEEPREFSQAEADLLASFSRIVVSQMELRQTARRDGLTGLLTRKAFQDRVAKRSVASDNSRAVLVIADIDHFKSINDAFGHGAGDQVLQKVSDCLVRAIRNGDTVGRIGGEEFAILLDGTTAEDALTICERLREAVAQEPLDLLSRKQVTMSFGLAELEPDESSAHWIQRADEALYAAKRGGRNRVVLGQHGLWTKDRRKSA